MSEVMAEDKQVAQVAAAAAEVEKLATENKPDAPVASVEPAVEALPKTIILYCDGGCRPNPGPGGWGMHGYMCVSSVPKKPSGHPEHVATARGYISKAKSSLRMGAEGKEDRRRYDRSIEVTVLHYIDGYGSFANPVTNNVAELEAATQAMRHAVDYEIERLIIHTDSEHVVKGLNSWVKAWRANDWLKPDGFPPANVEYWKRLQEAKERLEQRGVKVEVQWVRSHTDASLVHDDELGNIKADKLATAGVQASRLNQAITCVDVTADANYWKYAPEKSPLLGLPVMYFNTTLEYLKPGEYYLGSQTKDEDSVGKRISDGAYAVVRLEIPDPVLEMLRSHQAKLAAGGDTIIKTRMDQLFSPEVYQELFDMGPHALEQKTPYRLDLQTLSRQPLTRELRPPLLAMRAVDAISELADLLDKFDHQDASLTRTDLTPILYETSVKSNKKAVSITEVKLKAEYQVGYAALQVDANYAAEEGVKAAPITLTLGIDLPDRNALKRLEDKNPKVTLLTWLEAPGVFRYATVVEAGSDRGIWAGVYSNMRIVAA